MGGGAGPPNVLGITGNAVSPARWPVGVYGGPGMIHHVLGAGRFPACHERRPARAGEIALPARDSGGALSGAGQAPGSRRRQRDAGRRRRAGRADGGPRRVGRRAHRAGAVKPLRAPQRGAAPLRAPAVLPAHVRHRHLLTLRDGACGGERRRPGRGVVSQRGVARMREQRP
eukprot:gene4690-biopygen23490